MPTVGPNTLEHVGGGINTPFRERQARGERIEAANLLRPAYVLPAVLALAALALFFVPPGLLSNLPHPTFESSSEAPSAAASGGVSTQAIALQPSTETAAQGVPVDAAATSAAQAQSVAPSASTPAAPAAVGAADAGVDEVLAHQQLPPTIPVQVTAAEDSWMEVVDARGRKLLSRTVVAGESVGLDGALPMRVKVGNAHGTRLTLRGENVDLGPWTRDNIARLELK